MVNVLLVTLMKGAKQLKSNPLLFNARGEWASRQTIVETVFDIFTDDDASTVGCLRKLSWK